MRGAPFREVILMALAGIALMLPLGQLTRARPRPVAIQPADVYTNYLETWLDIRFSHPPQHFELFQNGKSLFSSSGRIREEDDLLLNLPELRTGLRVEVSFPEDTGPAYTEISLEPNRLPRQTKGFWSRKNQQEIRILEFSWPTP